VDHRSIIIFLRGIGVSFLIEIRVDLLSEQMKSISFKGLIIKVIDKTTIVDV
jgi:hypothetical protein